MRYQMLTMLNATRRVATGIGLLLISGSLFAANQLTLEGNTPEARHEEKSQLRLTVIDWTSAEQNQEVVNSIEQWREDGDDQAFAQTMKDIQTRGYLFTGEVTGYSIKYAARNNDGTVSALLVPGLKTKNRYMWETMVADDAPPFTLLELKTEGDITEVYTSLDGDINLSNSGLRLQEGYDYSVFGTLEDATPYYLREQQVSQSTDEKDQSES